MSTIITQTKSFFDNAWTSVKEQVTPVIETSTAKANEFANTVRTKVQGTTEDTVEAVQETADEVVAATDESPEETVA